ncbi:hypothetical protein RJZ56_000771 [Blastomyces dermatitidis]
MDWSMNSFKTESKPLILPNDFRLQSTLTHHVIFISVRCFYKSRAAIALLDQDASLTVSRLPTVAPVSWGIQDLGVRARVSGMSKQERYLMRSFGLRWTVASTLEMRQGANVGDSEQADTLKTARAS